MHAVPAHMQAAQLSSNPNWWTLISAQLRKKSFGRLVTTCVGTMAFLLAMSEAQSLAVLFGGSTAVLGWLVATKGEPDMIPKYK